MSVEQTKLALDLCLELPRVHERLFRCGLLRTAHAMDAAVKAIGYETAEMMEKDEAANGGGE